tara:strand:+ start:413 stop:1249 length:837 start_codon:yes stop_codon:yes gene_type:complete
MKFPDVEIRKTLFVGEGNATVTLGLGKAQIRGGAYVEAPMVVGAPVFGFSEATLMVANTFNPDSLMPPISLKVKGDNIMEGNGRMSNTLKISGPQTDLLYVDGDAFFTGAVDCGNKGKLASRFSAADGKPKPFDIQHPTKGKGHRLRYACIEGPEVGVYYRGRLKDSDRIDLPYYWKDLVAEESITVQLQPIGSRHFHLNVIEFTNEYIIVGEADDKPIDCFYHVYGERKDINPLITEYEGDSWEDYPDPNYDPNKVDSDERVYNDPRFSGPPNTNTK